jgi:hypothetical protein
MAEYLLVVTEGGYAKRIAVDDVRRTKRLGGLGVGVSRAPLVAALVVGEDGELLLASARGKVQRVAVASIPTRRRGTGASRGVRIMRCDPGDTIATGALAAGEADAVQIPPNINPQTIRAEEWPGGRVGLRAGERTRSAIVFGPLLDLDALDLPGDPAEDRETWALGAVHAVSAYWCVHCGREQPDPAAVYDCIDRHAARARRERERVLAGSGA